MADWTKAAEFVPSWYVPGKKPPAPSVPPTTTTPTPAPKDNSNSNNNNRINNNNNNRQQNNNNQNQQQQKNNNQNSNQQNNNNNNNSNGRKQQQNNNQNSNGGASSNFTSTSATSPKTKPTTPPQSGKQGASSAFPQTSSWVTPPMAPATDPAQKQQQQNNNSKLSNLAGSQKHCNNNNSGKNNNNSSALSTSAGDNSNNNNNSTSDAGVPPSLDLGLSASAAEFNPGRPYVVNAQSERNVQVRTQLDKPKEDTIESAIQTLGVKLSDTEAKKIVAESRMTVAAAAFVPAGFVPKMRANVKPVSLPSAHASGATINNVANGGSHGGPAGAGGSSASPDTATNSAKAASDAEKARDLSLIDTWCLYFDDDIKKSAEDFDPYLICHLSDIPTFWRVFQNVPTVSRQADNTNYYLFKEGIMPKWEDEKNKGGGAWTLKFQMTRSSDTIDATWERLCCQVVSENWTEDVRSTINGVVAKIRPRGVTFQLWVSKKTDSLLSQLQNRALAATLAAVVWEYVPHPKE